MPRKPRIYLPFDRWPAEDQARWQAAFVEGDRFDGSGLVRTSPKQPGGISGSVMHAS